MKYLNYLIMFCVFASLASALQISINTQDGQVINSIYSLEATSDVESTATLLITSVDESIVELSSESSTTHVFGIDTTSGAFPDGEYRIKITITAGEDEDVNELNVFIDNTAPTLLEYTVTGITQNSAVISFITSEESVSSIDYGTESLLGTTQSITEFATQHSFTLSNLLPGSDNYFEITVCDALSNCEMSGINAFVTAQEPAPDSPVVEETAKTIERYKGSLVITKNGIYLTYRLNHIKGLIFRTAAEKKVKTRISELIRIDENAIRFRIEDKKYTLELGKENDIDFDGDGTNDLQMTLLSIPDKQTAKFLFTSKYTAVLDNGIIFDDISDDVEETTMEEIETVIEELQEIVEENQTKMNWVLAGIILLVVLFVTIFVMGLNRKTRKL